MSITEKILGLVPKVRERAKSFLDFAKSTAGKVMFALLLVAAVLGYARHTGVESQKSTIERLTRELGEAKLKLASAQDQPVPYWQCNGPKETRHPRCPDETAPPVKSWLDDQASANEAITKKVKKYEQDLAKRSARSGDTLSADDTRRLLSIR